MPLSSSGGGLGEGCFPHFGPTGGRCVAARGPGVKYSLCLIEAGAEVNAPDKNGTAPLHRAVR
jgi:ankyrin repeat protein